MKILILGAGVTGLSMGQFLKNKCEVKILEKELQIGGIAKTKQVNGITYHTVGGHCFNSKYREIMSFVFNLLPEKKWHYVNRLSKINFANYEVDYPIEYSIKQIYEHDRMLAFEITRDFLSSIDNNKYNNLEDWFKKKFGNKLSDLYFIPYNTKIWKQNPKDMSPDWVVDKLPIPDKTSFFDGLIKTSKDNMPHAHFYYPNSNNQYSLIEALATQLDIVCNMPVYKISKDVKGWIVNDRYHADLLISTMPLNILPKMIDGVPDYVLDAADKLKYNKVSNVLWSTQRTDKTWTYQPLADTMFHRYIHIGNFFLPQQNYAITESIGEHSFDEMVECGRKDSFLLEPLDYNVSDYAYVVYDENRETSVKTIQEYLKKIGLISIGRFGQWDYFNMDVCMKQSHDTYLKLMNIL